LELLSAQRTTVSVQPDLTAGLASLAVARAGDLAGRIPSGRIVSAKPLGRAGFALGGVMILAAAVYWLMPKLAATGWNRFSHPFADHPPYASIAFDVEPGDTSVVYGSGVEIRAAVTGPAVDRIELVMHSQSSDSSRSSIEEVVPMFPETGGRW